MTLAFVSQGDAAHVCGHAAVMNKWNRGAIDGICPFQKGSLDKRNLDSISKQHLCHACRVTAMLSSDFFHNRKWQSSRLMQMWPRCRTHRRSVGDRRWFCQILFWLEVSSAASPQLLRLNVPAVHHGALLLTFLSSDWGWTTTATLPARRMDGGNVSPFQISNIPPTFTQTVLLET